MIIEYNELNTTTKFFIEQFNLNTKFIYLNFIMKEDDYSCNFFPLIIVLQYDDELFIFRIYK